MFYLELIAMADGEGDTRVDLRALLEKHAVSKLITRDF